MGMGAAGMADPAIPGPARRRTADPADCGVGHATSRRVAASEYGFERIAELVSQAEDLIINGRFAYILERDSRWVRQGNSGRPRGLAAISTLSQKENGHGKQEYRAVTPS